MRFCGDNNIYEFSDINKINWVDQKNSPIHSWKFASRNLFCSKLRNFCSRYFFIVLLLYLQRRMCANDSFRCVAQSQRPCFRAFSSFLIYCTSATTLTHWTTTIGQPCALIIFPGLKETVDIDFSDMQTVSACINCTYYFALDTSLVIHCNLLT